MNKVNYNIDINIACHYLEKIGNMGACIPFFGDKVIIMRGVLGLVQAAIGIFLRIYGSVGEVADKKFFNEQQFRKFQVIKEIGAEHARQGALNVCVAISQLIIGFFTYNLGNLFVHLYFKGNKGNFDPFIEYRGIRPVNSYSKTLALT